MDLGALKILSLLINFNIGVRRLHHLPHWRQSHTHFPRSLDTGFEGDACYRVVVAFKAAIHGMPVVEQSIWGQSIFSALPTYYNIRQAAPSVVLG